eukprot:213453-Rhodomonas_salina.3
MHVSDVCRICTTAVSTNGCRPAPHHRRLQLACHSHCRTRGCCCFPAALVFAVAEVLLKNPYLLRIYLAIRGGYSTATQTLALAAAYLCVNFETQCSRTFAKLKGVRSDARILSLAYKHVKVTASRDMHGEESRNCAASCEFRSQSVGVK